jgi:hypothetical protein
VNPNESTIAGTSPAQAAAAPPPPITPAPPPTPETWMNRFRGMFVRHLLVVGALGAMVMIGLFLSNYSSDKALYYWCLMFPLFGAVSVAYELRRARADGPAVGLILLRQVLHWIGPIIVVKILFMQHARGQMSTDAVALTTVLVLAVTSFLAGVNFEPSFLWISALLVLAALIGTEVETYLWLVVLLFVVGITLAVISFILLRRARNPVAAAAGPGS